MELKLNRDDTEQILMDWVKLRFPGLFNHVNIDVQYSNLRYVEFNYVMPENVPQKEEE